ncbi:hypothetical protein ROHU_021142 [Labeo rohita]|uniref:Uncharacterized protein n=1 Tax=Labeo rohita TaxID=84645 RepID=A0A498NAU5_LABRO|nr:hypothetical protein ROHU_032241 [Labeo rohita]RXN25937.1 hypothetical protein ROHU_021142 [Labeo rohita]
MQTTIDLMYNTTMQEELSVSFATTTFAATSAAEISCVIDAQLAFIATAIAGGIMLILLTSTIVLACTVSSLKRHHRAPRPSRSNADLVSGTGYWGTERKEGGIVGPCETSVLLEEVKTDGEEEDIHDGAAGPSQYITTSNAAGDSESIPTAMQSSTSRDSCIDPISLENMPLMV